MWVEHFYEERDLHSPIVFEYPQAISLDLVGVVQWLRRLVDEVSGRDPALEDAVSTRWRIGR